MRVVKYIALEDFKRIVPFSNGSRYVVSVSKGDVIRTSFPEHEVYKELIRKGKIKRLTIYSE